MEKKKIDIKIISSSQNLLASILILISRNDKRFKDNLSNS